jgi:membrane associated rhomboid family serine protease
VATAVYGLQIWRFISFQFLHANFNHILFNMIALYFFGPIVESYWGSRKYLAFYLLCGIAGPAMYCILWGMGFLIHDPHVPLVGASAGIFGVLIAAAQIAPNATVLIYGIIPMRLRMMALLLLAIAVYTTFTNGDNAGGEAAHLGGAAAGFFLMKNPKILSFLDFHKRSRMRIG